MSRLQDFLGGHRGNEHLQGAAVSLLVVWGGRQEQGLAGGTLVSEQPGSSSLGPFYSLRRSPLLRGKRAGARTSHQAMGIGGVAGWAAPV